MADVGDITFGLPRMPTKAQVREFLQVSAKTLERMLADGTLHYIKLGSAKSSPVRIPRDAMLERLGLMSRSAAQRRQRGDDAAYLRLKARMAGGDE